jgi:DNA-directed RNA polymerase specialized sigma24 family protein
VNRRALRDLSDKALIDAMRDGAPEAWQEFMMRFRPLLDRYARRTGIASADRAECIETVLEDSAIRWAIDGAAPPDNLAAYLLRAVTYRRKRLERDAYRLSKRYALAATIDGAVLSLCSAASVRESQILGERLQDEIQPALARFCSLLIEPLSEDDRMILARLGDGLPHREIAAELGLSYEAGRKRIQRLCSRLRDSVPGVLERLSDIDRAHVARILPRTKTTAERSRR